MSTTKKMKDWSPLIAAGIAAPSLTGIQVNNFEPSEVKRSEYMSAKRKIITNE